MAYADFVYYKTEYLGVSIEEKDFPRLALRASEYLDQLTHGAIPHPPPECVRRACCAIAEFDQGEEAGGIKASESVGGYSVNYAVSSVNVASADVRRYNLARGYLLNSGLLYGGVGR